MGRSPSVIPLIIDGEDILLEGKQGGITESAFQSATPELAVHAVESSAAAFPQWSRTSPQLRRQLLLKLAQLLKDRYDEIITVVQEEIHCGDLWAGINTQGGIDLVEETAAQITTAITGVIPPTHGASYGLVMKEPLGVVLGIAPWNAPVILGLRAVIAPIAAGNTAILKGSELSPRTHYLLASLFKDAGFPPGVVNFILHTPQDASPVYEAMINHPAVKKCNFTGSTQVGRVIASKAAYALKPVLLELGGKNFAIVLEDADLELAAEQILQGAFLNNGQICMSTDLVISTQKTSAILKEKLLAILSTMTANYRVISPAAQKKLKHLVNDARDKGASVHVAQSQSQSPSPPPECHVPPTLLTDLAQDMEFFHTESFGPVVGMITVSSEEDINAVIQGFAYGLSSAIFSRDHYRALRLAESINAGAVHVNSATVHDEATLPHGGRGDSGWGRFGARWGLEEFLQTKTVLLRSGGGEK